MNRNQINRVLRALRFYADPKNWESEQIDPNPAFDALRSRGSQLYCSPIERDKGEVARRALQHESKDHTDAKQAV